MITNASLTIYHKVFDEASREYKWKRYNYENVWFFGGKGASINKGYENANDVNVRIPYSDEINASNFKIGDIIVKGTLEIDITTQQDLKDYEVYNITSINDNNFGNNPHIHLGGK
jgi:hypothetical protein